MDKLKLSKKYNNFFGRLLLKWKAYKFYKLNKSVDTMYHELHLKD